MLLMNNIISSEKMSMLLYIEYIQQSLDIVNNEIEIESDRARTRTHDTHEVSATFRAKHHVTRTRARSGPAG